MLKTLIPLPLIARAQQAETSVRIVYADLDLSRASDRTMLDRRIDKALEQLCPSRRPGQLTGASEALRCQAHARQQIANARQQAQRAGAVRISAVP